MNLTKENMKKILLIITFTILVFTSIQNIPIVVKGFKFILGIIFPFIIGGAIAFILNVPMKMIERIFKNVKNSKAKKFVRPISLLLTLVAVTGIIFAIFFMVIPEIIQTFKVIFDQIPIFLDRATKWGIDIAVKFPPSIAEQILNINFDWGAILDNIFGFIQKNVTNFFTSTVNIATAFAGGTVKFILGLIFSLYVLLQKEKLARQVKLILFAVLPKNIATKTVEIGSLSNYIFSKFLSCQCLEACILGSLFFVAMSIFKIQYVLLISVLIGFTSLVPIFGAFVGCILGTFLIFMSDPTQALWFVLIFIVIQQLEGNLIYPYVVGESLGLPSIWVLVAVTVGGSLWGVVGILIFIPLCSVIYSLTRQATYSELSKKGLFDKQLLKIDKSILNPVSLDQHIKQKTPPNPISKNKKNKK